MIVDGETDFEPGPVMTFRIAERWIGVPVDKVDHIVSSSELCPVPLARPEHLGILDEERDLVPVFTVDPAGEHNKSEHLIAILHVRGEPMGLAVDSLGRVLTHFTRLIETGEQEVLPGFGIASRARCPEQEFWLVDPDRLWQDSSGPTVSASTSD